MNLDPLGPITHKLRSRTGWQLGSNVTEDQVSTNVLLDISDGVWNPVNSQINQILNLIWKQREPRSN
jgi:hypothetical protein